MPAINTVAGFTVRYIGKENDNRILINSTI